MTDSEPNGSRAEEGACFTALFERFWDSMVTDAATERQVAAIEGHLHLEPGARVVVVPSGCGRLALAFAARGYEVRGVDKSADSIDRCSTLAAQSRLRVEFRCRHDLECGDADCDGAISVGQGAWSDQLVACVAASLKPGARVVLEVSQHQAPEIAGRLAAEAGLHPVGWLSGLDGEAGVAPARLLLVCVRE